MQTHTAISENAAIAVARAIARISGEAEETVALRQERSRALRAESMRMRRTQTRRLNTRIGIAIAGIKALMLVAEDANVRTLMHLTDADNPYLMLWQCECPYGVSISSLALREDGVSFDHLVTFTPHVVDEADSIRLRFLCTDSDQELKSKVRKIYNPYTIEVNNEEAGWKRQPGMFTQPPEIAFQYLMNCADPEYLIRFITSVL